MEGRKAWNTPYWGGLAFGSPEWDSAVAVSVRCGGPTTEGDSVRAVRRALELGVNFFAVAPGYGNGKAEEVLGLALEGRHQEAIVATKVRLRSEEMDDVEVAVTRSVDASLRRLRTDACCHATTPTGSKSPSTTAAWWPMPGCSFRPPWRGTSACPNSSGSASTWAMPRGGRTRATK